MDLQPVSLSELHAVEGGKPKISTIVHDAALGAALGGALGGGAGAAVGGVVGGVLGFLEGLFE
jgi:hypothetical protein